MTSLRCRCLAGIHQLHDPATTSTESVASTARPGLRTLRLSTFFLCILLWNIFDRFEFSFVNGFFMIYWLSWSRRSLCMSIQVRAMWSGGVAVWVAVFDLGCNKWLATSPKVLAATWRHRRVDKITPKIKKTALWLTWPWNIETWATLCLSLLTTRKHSLLGSLITKNKIGNFLTSR